KSLGSSGNTFLGSGTLRGRSVTSYASAIDSPLSDALPAQYDIQLENNDRSYIDNSNPVTPATPASSHIVGTYVKPPMSSSSILTSSLPPMGLTIVPMTLAQSGDATST